MSHFTSVGFDAAGQASLARTLEAVFEAGRRTVLDDGSTLVTWSDACGAGISLALSAEGSLTCAKPWYQGPSNARVVRTAGSPTPSAASATSCSSMSCLNDGGQVLYPLAVETDVPPEWTRGLSEGEERGVSLAGFVEQMDTWEDGAAYEAEHSGLGALASRSFIPSGLFNPNLASQPASAHGLATGIVTDRTLTTNPLSGLPFLVMEVESYGVTLHAVTDAHDDPPSVGTVVRATVWMLATEPVAT